MDKLPPKFTKFLSRYPVRKFKKNQTLLFQGEVPSYAYFIIDGIVKAYNITSTGEEQIIALSSPHDIVPESWVMGEAPVAYYFYEAFIDTDVYIIPREELGKEIQNDPELTRLMLNRFMKLYVGSRMHINALEQPKSRDKLVHLLYYLISRFGKNDGDTSRIELRLTHQTLANMIGVTRETIAVELSRLRKEKVVTYKQQTYFVSKPRLLKLRNEDELATNLN